MSRFVRDLWAEALALALLAGLISLCLGAPAPMARREKGVCKHPAELCGPWRLGWSMDVGEAHTAFDVTLRPDGGYQCGGTFERPSWVGTWEFDGRSVLIRERPRLTEDASYWRFAVPASGRQRIPEGSHFARTVVWLERPEVTE